MQPTAIRVGASASANCAVVASDMLRIALGYGPSGTVNNGNVREQTITQPTLTASQSFEYDELNRVSTASEGSDCRNFGYSATGNMWVTAANAGWTPPSFTPRTSAWFDTNNRLGNAGLGVQYDAAGEFAAEYGGPAQTPGTHYLTTDHLGSTRLVTDGSDNVVSRHDYLPFGEEIPAGIGGRTAGMMYVANSTLTQRFTGKERDTETGLDYFGARYLSGAMGRFMSPDNFLNDTTALDPQSWNLYAYVRNNPLRYVDPNGEKIYAGDLSAEGQEELLRRINATYGCKGCTSVDKTGYLQVDTSSLSKQMLAATDYLTGAINSTSFFARVEVSNNDPGLAFGETRLGASSVEWNGRRTNASLIRLDFGDDRWIGGDSAAKQTFLNTVFAHEVAHVFPTYLRDPNTSGPTGPVVDAVNRITDLLGQPRRTGYMSSPVGGHWLSLPFSKATVDRNGQHKERAVQIQWMRRNVGGRGVN